MNEPATTVVGALQQIVERSRQLYSLPAVALEVIELTAQPQVDSRALRACIENDPALTAKILRVVNSSLFGLSRQVSDLNQALALLGIKPLSMLVLGFSLPKDLFRGVQADVLGRYWRHTLVKAVACRELCEQVWRTPGDDAFVAGLLQDIGMLTLIQDLGDSYVQFLEQVHAHGGGVLAMEIDWLGFDHTVVSARLLDHWGLPKSLAAAVAVAPDAERIMALPEAQRGLPQVLHLAELLARLVEHPYGSALHSLLAVGEKYRRLTYPQVQTIVDTLQIKVKELATVLSLELPDDQSFPDLLIAAHAQLSEITEETGGESGCAAEAKILRQTMELRTLAAPTTTSARRVEPIAAHAPHTSTNPSASTDPGLQGRMAAALVACRHARCPLSLALLEIESYPDLVFSQGQQRATALVENLHRSLESWLFSRGSVTLAGEARFALIWEDCDRSEAASLARQILVDVKKWQASGPGEKGPSFALSIGLATLAMPSKNFPPQQLVTSAERCLSGAKLSGGDTVKSIEF